ncbi:MAG TPA: M48 family metalloprotease [Vicinamibacterales bacterium]
MITQLLPAWVAAILALVPGVAAFWFGRAAAVDAADPARPERLAALRKRASPVFGFCAAILFVTAIDDCVWALPLMVFGRMVAGYYIRRTLYGETWSLAAYLSFFLRLIFASFGPWVFIAIAPAVVASWPARPWLAASLLTAALCAWNEFYSDVFIFVMRARPIASGDLRARFNSLAERCALSPVWFGQVSLGGGVLANAVALPSIRRPGAVFTSSLLEQLTDDEAVAICAHEIAHLEYYKPRLRRNSNGTDLMIAVGCFIVPFLQPTLPWLVSYWYFIWVPLLVVAMALRARKRQQNETASDLRALELTGNADALISALVKLHATMHIARRWDPEFERQATHPSLARRIQAIRNAAGTPHPVLGAATELIDPTSSVTVGLHADRLHWTEGEAISHRVAYSHLSELRIVTAASGAPKLRATTRTGQRWEMTLAPADVARAQAALDVIDSRLAPSPAPGAMPDSYRHVAVIATLAAASFVMQGAVALATLLALLRPSTATLAGAGAAALTAAVLGLLAPGYDAPLMLLLVLCGAGLLAAAYFRRHDVPRHHPGLAIAALAAATALAWLLLVATGNGAWQLHQAARTWPAAATLPAALAAAVACGQNRRARTAGIPVAAAAIAVGFIASPQFVATCVRDPFVSGADPDAPHLIVVDEGSAKAAPLAFIPNDVRISSDGRYMAALAEGFDDETTTVHLGAVGGALVPYHAKDAVFAGEDRVLLLEQREWPVVRVLRLGDPVRDEQPAVPLPGIEAHRIVATPSGDGWMVFGSIGERTLVTVAAPFGVETPTRREWASQWATSGRILAAAADRVLVQRTSYRPNMLAQRRLWQLAYLLGPAAPESEFWTIDLQGERTRVAATALPVSCDSRSDLTSAICAAYDGAATRLFAFDPAAAAFKPAAVIRGQMIARHVSQDGWLTGWVEGGLVAVQPRTNEMIRMGSAARVYAMTATDHLIAAAAIAGRGSVIQIYTRTDISARR